MSRRLLQRRLIELSLVGAAWIALSGFTPFTPVKNVCPTCKAPPKFDVVKLVGGNEIKCNVVGQNPEYYILERFGEYRSALKTEVQAVEWSGGKPKKLVAGDQIILKNGLTFHGAIVGEQKDRNFTIQVGPRKVIVWNTQIEALYKKGVKQELTAPAPAKPTKTP